MKRPTRLGRPRQPKCAFPDCEEEKHPTRNMCLPHDRFRQRQRYRRLNGYTDEELLAAEQAYVAMDRQRKKDAEIHAQATVSTELTPEMEALLMGLSKDE